MELSGLGSVRAVRLAVLTVCQKDFLSKIASVGNESARVVDAIGQLRENRRGPLQGNQRPHFESADENDSC